MFQPTGVDQPGRLRSPRACRGGIGLLVFTLLNASAAFGQGEPPVNEEAHAAFQQAAQAYNAGDFERAAASFLHAYELSGRPNMLFNVAQAYRLAGPAHCAEAYRYYTRYLNEERAPLNRKEVEDRLVELAPCAPKPVPAPLLPLPAPAQPSVSVAVHEVQRPPFRPARWLFVGAGAFVTSGALMWGASQAELQAARARGFQSSAPVLNGWHTAQGASYAVLGLGGLGLAAGIASFRF